MKPKMKTENDMLVIKHCKSVRELRGGDTRLPRQIQISCNDVILYWICLPPPPKVSMFLVFWENLEDHLFEKWEFQTPWFPPPHSYATAGEYPGTLLLSGQCLEFLLFLWFNALNQYDWIGLKFKGIQTNQADLARKMAHWTIGYSICMVCLFRETIGKKFKVIHQYYSE